MLAKINQKSAPQVINEKLKTWGKQLEVVKNELIMCLW